MDNFLGNTKLPNTLEMIDINFKYFFKNYSPFHPKSDKKKNKVKQNIFKKNKEKNNTDL